MEHCSTKRAVNIVHTSVTAEGISRYEILSWINATIGTKLNKIEELATGSVYCELTENLFGPGTVNIKRVKYDAQTENDFIHNFKLLQMAFNKYQVDRAIPIEKLVKGRYQDNYDFIQWFKVFYDANDKTYARRREISLAKNTYPYDNDAVRSAIPKFVPTVGIKTAQKSDVHRLKTALQPEYRMWTGKKCGPAPVGARSVGQEIRSMKDKLTKLSSEFNKTGEKLDYICFERNLYYGKMVDIECYIQEHQEKQDWSNAEVKATLNHILDIVYRDYGSSGEFESLGRQLWGLVSEKTTASQTDKALDSVDGPPSELELPVHCTASDQKTEPTQDLKQSECKLGNPCQAQLVDAEPKPVRNVTWARTLPDCGEEVEPVGDTGMEKY